MRGNRNELIERLRTPIDPDDPDLWKLDEDRREAADQIARLCAECDDWKATAETCGKFAALKDAEIERLRAQTADLRRWKAMDKPITAAMAIANSHIRDKDADNERLRGHLQTIADWAKAYPLEIFPEPDLKRAHELLKAGGMSLDAISAHAMRHVITQVGEIARCALEDKPCPTK